MPRRLRYVVPDELVEVTQRTFQGFPLLRPDAAFNQILLGVLGRALRKYQMVVCAFAVLSNHFHLLIRPRNAQHQAAFMNYFSSNLAREVGHLRGWSDGVWGRRYAAVPITGEPEAQLARLKYVLSQGVKEGLVATAREWPGASCVPQMLDSTQELVGLWYDRTALYRLNHAGHEVTPADWISEERVVLSPLPCLEHLPEAERTAIVENLLREIESEAAASNVRPVAGVEAVLAQDVRSAPKKLKRTPIPLVHAASIVAWKAFRAAYRAFVAAYQYASTRLRAGVRDVAFPEGSFPPPLPFVSCAPT